MSKTPVCKRADIPENGMKGYDVNGKRILIASSGDTYYAYQGICPHQEVCLDEGFYDGSVLTCHQHLWQWDIKTGDPIGLAEARLESYQVSVEDDQICVVSSSALGVAELFASLSEQTRDRLEQLARREEYPSGSSLYNIGDPVDDLYILESGRVEFVVGRDDRTSAAGFMLRKGELFGWAALLESQPTRIARARCLEDSAVLRLNGKQTLEVLADDPASGFIVMRNLTNLITRHLTAPGDQ
jgi:toluene monooxygenase system ferredoxin subunit